METVKYAPPNDSQTSFENGLMKEKVDGGSFDGFCNNMDIPRVINGIVKSAPLSLSAVRKTNCAEKKKSFQTNSIDTIVFKKCK